MGIIINGQNDTIGPVDSSMSLLGTVSIGGTMTIEDFTNIDSVGLITARNGLHVTSGNVAIGHNNPLNTLHVKGPTGGVSARFTDAVNATVFVSHPSSGKSKIADAGGNYGFEFDTASVNILSGGSERLRITSAGVLQAAAGVNLQMASNGRIFVGNGGNATDPMFANVSDTNTGIAFPAADTMMFTTGGSERLRITSDGQMGLGTNDPNSYGSSVKLAVANTSGTCGLSIVSATNGDGNLYYADGTSGDATYRGYIRYNHTLDQFRIGVAGAERLRITSAGLVGIDVTSPTANLDVNGSLQLRGSGNTTYATKIYTRLDSTHCSVIESYLNSSTAFEMIGTYADGGGVNPRIAIGAGGQNVGINLTDPAYDLDVAGSIRAKGTGPGAGLLLHTNTGVTASANLMQIWSSQPNGFSFHTNGTGDGSNEVMRLTGAGHLNIGGNYTQTSYRLQVDGSVKGDYFTGESLSNRTGYKWGASGIYYLTLGGSRSGNGSSFTMFELTGMQNSKFVEIQISFAHAGGGSHGSYRRAVYTSNAYQGLNTLENVQYNYGGGLGFTISKPSNGVVRVVWNGCTSFADGYALCCEVKTSNSGTVFQNVDSAFS